MFDFFLKILIHRFPYACSVVDDSGNKNIVSAVPRKTHKTNIVSHAWIKISKWELKKNSNINLFKHFILWDKLHKKI